MTATLDIDVLDAEGHATGQTVPVVVEYVTICYEYGSNDDGKYGEPRYEREVLDVYIEAEHLLTLTSTQVEQVIAEAKEQCAQQRR